MVCDWFEKRSATYSTNKLQNQSPLGLTRFPAIGTGHVHFLRVPIGSQYFGISRPWTKFELLNLFLVLPVDTQINSALRSHYLCHPVNLNS